MLSKETKDIIKWIADMTIKRFQDQIKKIEELKSDEETRFGDEDHMISTYKVWISEIEEAFKEIWKA